MSRSVWAHLSPHSISPLTLPPCDRSFLQCPTCLSSHVQYLGHICLKSSPFLFLRSMHFSLCMNGGGMHWHWKCLSHHPLHYDAAVWNFNNSFLGFMSELRVCGTWCTQSISWPSSTYGKPIEARIHSFFFLISQKLTGEWKCLI